LVDLVLALLLWPIALLLLASWFVWRNGAIVASRSRRAIHRQFFDQIRLYFAAGVLPPWYYIYELFDRPRKRHARGFIYRCECKSGVIAILKERRPPESIVSDKVAFAERCHRHAIPTIAVLGVARSGCVTMTRRARRAKGDWFVKPVDGKGGKGIERWDQVGRGRFRGSEGQILPRSALLKTLAERSLHTPLFIQPRVENHPALAALANDALTTVRALTCLDERRRPEFLGAVLRMAIGDNHVVDNLHAGGIAAGIDLETGTLGPASNLGMAAELGWLARHPNSGAQISGIRLPFWNEFAAFVIKAHEAFADRILIGWDIAITPTGLVVVEANGAPDLDIMQRPFRRGLMRERLGQLLAFHLQVDWPSKQALAG
jgi:hypothetical protein